MEFSSSDDNNGDYCAICFENYTKAEILPCKHRFCKDPCFTNLLKRSQGDILRCPLCRQSYKIESRSLINKTGILRVHESVAHLEETIVTISQMVQDKNESCSSKYKSKGESRLKFSLSSIKESDCFRCLVNLSVIVLFIHCLFVGLGRITAGFYQIEKTSQLEDVLVSVAIFQIAEGFLNSIIITTLLLGNNVRRKCFPVLVLVSVICLTYGSTTLWTVSSNNIFVLVSRYYSVFDWVMIVYQIVFGYYMID
ncbi:uncharacterized protein LOC132748068 [Ruditapes philippinarum]|uniref:uncharacterized protein LOC132748068 n=1 Tax=Ruditapes philippinarum TaxID=129788 RepID=UPI00295A9D6D|nr:uncharacterized protein LOC132748068 [Ruditapes philippinarum]